MENTISTFNEYYNRIVNRVTEKYNNSILNIVGKNTAIEIYIEENISPSMYLQSTSSWKVPTTPLADLELISWNLQLKYKYQGQERTLSIDSEFSFNLMKLVVTIFGVVESESDMTLALNEVEMIVKNHIQSSQGKLYMYEIATVIARDLLTTFRKESEV